MKADLKQVAVSSAYWYHYSYVISQSMISKICLYMQSTVCSVWRMHYRDVGWSMMALQLTEQVSFEIRGNCEPSTHPKKSGYFSLITNSIIKIYPFFQCPTCFQIYKTKGHHQLVSKFTWNFIVEGIPRGHLVHSPCNNCMSSLFSFPDMSVKTHLNSLHDWNSAISLGKLSQCFIIFILEVWIFLSLNTWKYYPTTFSSSGLTIRIFFSPFPS